MKKKGLFWLSLFALFGGASTVLFKSAVSSGVGPLAFAFAASLVAFLVLTPFSYSKEAVASVRKNWFDFALVGISASGVAVPLLFIGLALTTATNAGFIIALTPVFTVLSARFLLKERLPNGFFIVLAAMTLGGLLLSFKQGFGSVALGDLFVFGAVLCFGFSNSYAKKVMLKFPADLVSYARFFFSTVFLLAAIAFLAPHELPTIAAAPAMVLAASLLSVAALFSLFRGIDAEGASVSSVANFGSALVTAAIAFFFLGEVMAPIQFAGAFLIALGSLLLTQLKPA